MLSRGDLRLLLSAPGRGEGAGQSMPDGRRPEPGGWNRISFPSMQGTGRAPKCQGVLGVRPAAD
jgi:hypothetical protein